jgi:electron transport complex protein RnfD
MWLVACCGFIVVIQSSIGDTGASLLVAFAALFSAWVTELLITHKSYGFLKLQDGSAAASAMVLALMLPNQIPPLYAALGAAFAVAVIKHSFGGLGSNWMNPALGGWLFIRFSWPAAFAGALNGASQRVPESLTAAGGAISDFLNKVVFTIVNSELPSGYIELFSLREPGIIADRAVLMLIFVTVLIASSQVSRSWVSFLFLGVYGLLVRMAGDLPGGSFWNGDLLYAFLSGGTLVTAFLLIADPASGAKSAIGNAIAAICTAFLSLAFRYFGNTFYGCFFAVALMNALTPLLFKLERRLFYSEKSGGRALKQEGT